MRTNIKNELGNRYGDFEIIAEHPIREPSNGCVKWVGICVKCGAIRIINGNMARHDRHFIGVYRVCKSKNKKRGKRWT